MSTLDAILRDKAREVARCKKSVSAAMLRQTVDALPRKKFPFRKALGGVSLMAVIAEIKRKSPSKGLLCADFEPVRLAKELERAGASALSVLTDEKYFGGAPGFIARIKRESALPILRKDFIIDEYQVYESRLLGADAILLIARALTPAKLRHFYALAQRLGMDTLFEVHDERDLKKVLPLRPVLVGVNNRDLATFRTDLKVSERLAGSIPAKCFFISESGIRDRRDLRFLNALGVRAVLVGESLMREKSPGRALQRLLGNAHGSR